MYFKKKQLYVCISAILQKYVEQIIPFISYFWYSSYFCKMQFYVFQESLSLCISVYVFTATQLIS